jgi:4-alpha-glucanotransferase
LRQFPNNKTGHSKPAGGLLNAEVQEVTDTGMRASGLLLPIFSLPGKYGIGCFSDEAYRFVEFVKEAGQKYW